MKDISWRLFFIFIVNVQFLDGEVPRSTPYGVYISQLIRFARVSSHVVDFDAHNKGLTAKLLQQDCRYHKLRKTFSKFYCRHYELVSKFNVGLKHFCTTAYRSRNFKVTLNINLKNKNILYVGLIFLISSEKLSYGQRQSNLVFIAYASSEGSGEPAHPRSLARTSAARSYRQWVKRNLKAESQIPGPSKWLDMRS